MNEYEAVKILEIIVKNISECLTDTELDALLFCIKRLKASTEYKLGMLREAFEKVINENFGAEVKND